MSLVVAQCLLKKKKQIRKNRKKKTKGEKERKKEVQFRKADRVRGIFERSD